MPSLDWEKAFIDSMRTVQMECYTYSRDNGFWMGLQDIFASKIALAHSELSEALEAHRKPHPDFKTRETQWWREGEGLSCSVSRIKDGNHTKPEGVGIELADAVIRIMDIAGRYDIDLAQCILDKMEYNRSRPYKHGKEY